MRTTAKCLAILVLLFVALPVSAESRWTIGLYVANGDTNHEVKSFSSSTSDSIDSSGASISIGKTGSSQRNYLSLMSLEFDDAFLDTVFTGTDWIAREDHFGGYFGLILGYSTLSWEEDVDLGLGVTAPLDGQKASNFSYGARAGAFIEIGDNWVLDVSYQWLKTDLRTEISLGGFGDIVHTIDTISTVNAGVLFQF